MQKKEEDKFSQEEAAQRFRAALRGARIAGHVPMKEKPKVNKAANKKSKKSK